MGLAIGEGPEHRAIRAGRFAALVGVVAVAADDVAELGAKAIVHLDDAEIAVLHGQVAGQMVAPTRPAVLQELRDQILEALLFDQSAPK